ncbi:MAG: glycosyltransferase [Bacteroidaceae bacterium]|nr:glycosyltransferase [Bacteroidaceae bacterium]
MKVLQINAVDDVGSTGTVISDIQDVCIRNGIECHIAYSVTRRHKSDIINGYHIGNWFDHKLHALLSRVFRKQAYFSTIPTCFFLRYIDRIKPDLVHLHNLHANYINLNMLLRYLAQRDIATVVTLHDNWFFTGGCCLPELDNCTNWQKDCRNCIYDKRGYNRFLPNTSEKILLNRKCYFNAIPRLFVVGVSKWMTGEARKSILGNAHISTIRNGVRTEVFCPIHSSARRHLRMKYGFKDSDFVILAPASKWLHNRNRQGLQIILDNLNEDEKIVLYGCSKEDLAKIKSIANITAIPFIKNKVVLSTIYSMSDVFINCTHMDTCSFINIECQACGTPVITFDNTGAAETVDNVTSFSVPTDDYMGIVTKISEIKNKRYNTIEYIRSNFTMEKNYNLYISLYRKIINSQQYLETPQKAHLTMK